MPRLELATAFDWDTFVRRYWNQRPVLYKGTSASPFELSDAFEAAAGATRTYLRDGAHSEAGRRLQFTLDRMQQLSLEPWLPRKSDGSLEGYDARIASPLKGRRYALVAATLHASGVRLWAKERAFFSELWQRVGMPLTGGITTLFHGNYEHSPVGVHLDRFTTFLFALKGRKRMRFWPKKPWKEPATTLLDYAPYVKDSFTAEVEPGDILYWPSTYYHVGESAGPSVATSVNVGIPISEQQTVYYVDDLLPSRPRSEPDPLVPGLLSAPGPLSSKLPSALLEAARELRAEGRLRQTRRHFQEQWLQRLSAGGFVPAPEPERPRRLRDADQVRVDPRFPILIEKDGARGWLCCANGHSLRTEGSSRAFPRLFETLNSGQPVRVSDLLRPFRPPAREGVRGVLETLQGFRALIRSPLPERE